VSAFLVVTTALLLAPAATAGIVGLLWVWVAALLGAALIIGAARRCVPGAANLLWRIALLLPRAERDLWRAEILAVLHACTTDAERRRQVRGFLAATPGTIVTSWRTRR
jgi:hypothetical protein